VPEARPAFRLPAASSLRRLALRVRDLEAAVSFYADRLGMPVSGRDGGRVALAPAGGAFAIDLVHAPQAPVRPHPSIGLYHFALHVGDLAEGERFYAGVLGLDVTQRSYPGALFLSVGGYHHHVGLNTWAQGRRAPDGATGLIGYAWAIPAGALAQLRRHLRDRGVPFEDTGAGIAVTDPAGIGIDLREA